MTKEEQETFYGANLRLILISTSLRSQIAGATLVLSPIHSVLLTLTLVLHISALNSLNELAAMLFSILKEKVSDENVIKAYVNAQTDEGFTALHFASFRGNIVTTQSSIVSKSSIEIA